MKVEWEKLEYKAGLYEDVTYRMRIPGGWLYRYGVQSDKATIVFVPLAADRDDRRFPSDVD